MAKIKGVALTEKGQVKPLVRDNVSEFVRKQALKGINGAEIVEGKKNLLVVSHSDSKDNDFYTTITFTTSATHPSNLAERKSKPKATETVEFEIVEEE